MLPRLSSLLALALVCVAYAAGGTLSLKWTTDKEPVSYRVGEPMKFALQLLDDDQPVAGKTIKWVRTGDDGLSIQGEAVSSTSVPLTITTSIRKPGFVRLEISIFNADGSPEKSASDGPVKFHGGAGAEPEKLTGSQEPEDFDAFWKKQKARLATVPMKAALTKVESEKPGYDVYDVRVDCLGGKPVAGYLSIPQGAAPKSIGAQVYYSGYGVRATHQRSEAGAIVFQVNAHGIENAREPAYYKALENGELKGYAFDNKENANPETAYFNGMMLRALRALEYVKSRPEWNGRDLIAGGSSQGGLQAITVAGLDTSVTRCLPGTPWCVDLGGIKMGRIRGWRPDYTEALAYYDPAHMGKRLNCPVSIDAGLGDYVCPPSGLSVLYNNIKAPKSITYIQGGTHFQAPKGATRQTLRSK